MGGGRAPFRAKETSLLHLKSGFGCIKLRIVNMKVIPFNFLNPHNEHVVFSIKKSLLLFILGSLELFDNSPLRQDCYRNNVAE